jgi:lysine 6-dehydrogenase
MRMLVLGAGLQGSACAYDLLQRDDVTEVRLAGLGLDHLPAFLKPFSGPRLLPTPLDVRDHDAVGALMRDSDAVACALPYYFNLEMTRLAIEAGVPFCDLGGNTGIVFEQKELAAEAQSRGVSVIPDCGLAPGMVNILAQQGIAGMDRVDAVRIYVGGLPLHPEPPLGYQIVYSLEGVLDYYTTPSWILRDGKRTQIAALSEVETVEFDEPLGALEAFHTAGGLSTMAFRYEGRVPTMEYKTLRYPGHASVMRGIRDLGFFDQEPVVVDGLRVAPRQVAVAVMTPRLTSDAPDLVALRVTVTGTKGGEPALFARHLVDHHDAGHGISAMMRTTGFSLAITGWMLGSGVIARPGVHTPDEVVPAEAYVRELAARGVRIAPGEGDAGR